MKQAIKEISIIMIAILFLFGGLALVLQYTNGIMLLGIISIGIGGLCFAWLLKDIKRNNQHNL